MEWQGRLNEAMDYVEENLSGRIDPERAAQLAACSGYHFQRMFAYLTGVTFSEYVRRRRMSAAALELLSGDARVIDLAARYGYESPTAFNRAFQAVHGVPPSAARTKGVSLSSFPRMTFTLTLKGAEKMDYRIENKGPIRVVGAALKGTMDFDESQKRIPLFWNEMGQAGLIPRLCALMDGSEPAGVLGVSLCGDGVCNGYYIAVATGRDVPEGMEAYDIPAGPCRRRSRACSAARSPNGCRPRATSTPTRPTSRSILTAT